MSLRYVIGFHGSDIALEECSSSSDTAEILLCRILEPTPIGTEQSLREFLNQADSTLVCTSKQSLLRAAEIQPLKGRTVFVVGEASATLAAKLGAIPVYNLERSGVAGLEILLQQYAERSLLPGEKILYLRGEVVSRRLQVPSAYTLEEYECYVMKEVLLNDAQLAKLTEYLRKRSALVAVSSRQVYSQVKRILEELPDITAIPFAAYSKNIAAHIESRGDDVIYVGDNGTILEFFNEALTFIRATHDTPFTK